MTPEATALLQAARVRLERGRRMLAAQLPADAGRMAYLAAFHAAQALLLERRGKPAKTHRGVQTEFARLALAEPLIDVELRAFLSRAYVLKTVSDYEVGEAATVDAADAADALATAERFLACIAALIAA